MIDSQGRRTAFSLFLAFMILPPKAVSIETVAGLSDRLSEYYHRYRRFTISVFIEIASYLRRPGYGHFSYRHLPYLQVKMTFVID